MGRRLNAAFIFAVSAAGQVMLIALELCLLGVLIVLVAVKLLVFGSNTENGVRR